MNKAALTKAIQESEFISDPETFEALIIDSSKIVKAVNPLKATDADVISMAHLILKFEDAFLDDEEDVIPSNTEKTPG